MVKVAMLMHTPAVVCRPQTTLRDVANLMEARNVGSVVVVDAIGYVTGIVTDRDVALKGAGRGRSPDTDVEAVMTRDVAVVSPASDIAEAASIMQKRGVRRVPVVDDLGRVHGMVAMDDLVRHVSHMADSLTDTMLDQALHLRSAP